MKAILTVLQDNHPCRETYRGTTVPPACLTAEDGRCAVYDRALFCPKFGAPVGAVKRYGRTLVELDGEGKVTELWAD